MFENEIRELFELSLRVMNETESYVSFGVMANTSCNIFIYDVFSGLDRDYDGAYSVCFSEILKEESSKEYQKAKEHLTRILGKGRCPV